MRHFYGISLLVSCLFFYGFAPAWSDSWTWSGDAGTSGWYDTLQISFPPDPVIYVNNWGKSGNPPAFPGGADDVTLGNNTVVLNNNAAIHNLNLDGSLGIQTGKNLIISNAIQNNGLITVNSTGGTSNTYLQFEATTTLSGNGELHLNQAGTFAELKTNTGVTLTQDEMHTISGFGRISALLINQGLIDADSNGNTLELVANSKSNSGTIRASNGGILSLQSTGSVYDNTDGTIETLNASRAELNDNVTIIGGTLSGAGSGIIRSLSAYNSANPATLDNLANAGTVEVFNQKSLRLTGTINNTGSILVNSSGAGTYLRINGDVTLTGNGALSLSYSTGDTNHVQGTGGNRLINDTDQTIKGSGGLGENTLEITNRGTIQADQARAMDLDPQTELINSGTLRALNGATLNLNAANYNNSGGSINALDASLVGLFDNVNITGGTLTSAGSGIIRSLSNYNSANPATLTDLTNAGSIEVYNQKSLRLAGTIDNSGTILVNSTGSTTSLRISGNATLSGTGLVRLSYNLGFNTNQVIGTGNNRLTNQASHSIKGSGGLGGDSLALTNYGLIEADQARVLEIDPANAPADTLKGFINYGTVRASASGGLTIYGSTFSNPGTLEATGSSTLTCIVAPLQHSGSTLTDGTWIARANSSLILSVGSNITTNQGTVILDGPGSTFAKINTLADNQDTFQVLGGRNFTTVGNLANSGSLLASGGTFSVTGNLTGTGNTTVTDSALLYAGIIVQNSLTIGSGAKVVISSSSSDSLASAGNLTAAAEPQTWLLIFSALFFLGAYRGIIALLHRGVGPVK